MRRPNAIAGIAYALAVTAMTLWVDSSMADDRTLGASGDDTESAGTSPEGGDDYRIPLKDLRLTVVYDNNPNLKSLRPEWGFSCLIEGAEKTILFDTGGDAPVLLANMDSLSIKPDDIDLVVLSHEHGDHTGGLMAFLGRNPDVKVYIPRSFKGGFKRQVKELGAEVVEVKDPTEICKAVYSVGELGGWIKEQSLAIRTDKGLVVITGCAHPGISLIVDKAKELIPDPVLLAMGGFHLMRESEDEIGGIIAHLRQAGVLYAGPCHCSGDAARHLFKAEFGDHYVDIGVGTTITGDHFK